MGDQQLPLLIVLLSPELSTAGLVPLAMAAAAEKAAICSSLFFFFAQMVGFSSLLRKQGEYRQSQPSHSSPCFPLLLCVEIFHLLLPGWAELSRPQTARGDEVSQIPK